MSHEATNWAIKQRGLKPATKIVLWHLCDRHNPDYGCFPCQDRLAEDCEMSRSTLNIHLKKLEDAGLIRREKRVDNATGLRKSTFYRLGFEVVGPQDVDAHVRKSDMVSMSGFGAYPCPDSGHIHVRNPDTNLVREPLREPVKPRDAREVEILRTVLSEKVANDYALHRRKKRAKLTPRAAELIVAKLDGHPNPDAVVERSIMNGWTGVFPDGQTGGGEQLNAFVAGARGSS